MVRKGDVAALGTHINLEATFRRWRLGRYGSFRLCDSDGRPIIFRGRKVRAIIAYLATHAGQRTSRDRLIDLLWGDRGEAQARGSLRQSLFEIRRVASDLIASDHDHVWIDCARLEPDEWDRCEADEQLFDDLEGITPQFDDWLRCQRSNEAAKEWADLRRQAEEMLASGEGATALPLIQRMQAIDPYNEDWLRLAMQAERQVGHPAAIHTRFRQMEDVLKRELGVSLSAQTRTLHDQLLAELSGPTAAPVRAEDQWGAAAAQQSSNSSPSASRPWLAAAGVAGLLVMFGIFQTGQTPLADQSRIAVLPFRASSGVDPALAEGMAEEVLSDLSQQGSLQTVGRTSSWMFKDKAEDLRSVGRKLDVRYVVEGSVRRDDSALRLTIALIDTRDSSTVWSGRFVSASGDAQRMEGAATAAIIQRLAPQQVSIGRHANPRAYAMYLRARTLMRQRDRVKIQEAHDLLEGAVKLDPKFAPAWAQLAGALTFLGGDSIGRHDNSTGERALAAARRAVALDPNLADGHQMLAFALGWSMPESRVHLRRALQLEPRNTQSLYWWGQIAHASGNMRLQEQAVRRAYDVDPLWRRPAELMAIFALHDGSRSEAYRYLERLRTVDPDGAIEVEMSLAYEEGDLSRVVELGRSPANISAVNASGARLILAAALMRMGYVPESLLLSEALRWERWAYLRRLPDRKSILAATRDFVGTSDEPFRLAPVIFELARTHRYDDIKALYERPGSSLSGLADIKDGNRYQRASMAALIGRALASSGRTREAARLYRSADEATRVMLANGRLMKTELAAIGVTQAILGRKEPALLLLKRAVKNHWLEFAETPRVSSLHGDPRFEQLRKITDERLRRERGETEALALL